MSIFISTMNDTYEKYHKGKFYSWYTNRNMTTDCCYTAFGSKITAAFIQAYGENKMDALDYLSKHLLYAESEYFKPEMKGGHRDNAYMNSISRKLYRSKAKRRTMRKQRNTTRQLVKGPLDLVHAYKYIQKRVYDNAEEL